MPTSRKMDQLGGPDSGQAFRLLRTGTAGKDGATLGLANYPFAAAYSDVQHGSSGTTTKVGVVTLDGNEGFLGTVDVSGATGLSANQSINGTYMVNPNGSGDLGVNAPLVTSYFSSTTAPVYFIDESPGVVHPVVSKLAP